MSFEKIRTSLYSPEKSRLYLKKGSVYRLVVRGDPIEYRQHFEQGPQGRRPVVCPGAACAQCESGDRPQVSYAVQVAGFNLTTGTWTRVLEGPPQLFQKLDAIDQNEGLSGHLVEVSRSDSASMDEAFDAKLVATLNEDQRVAMERVPKIDLATIYMATTSATPAALPPVTKPKAASYDPEEDPFKDI